MRTKHTLLLGLLFSFCFASISYAQNVNRVIDQLQAQYRNMGPIQATFVQRMNYNGRAQNVQGNIVLYRNKYYIKAGDQELATDGNVTYAYSRQENQLMITDYVDDENAFNPETFFLTQDNKYNIRLLGNDYVNGSAHYKLLLTPKQRDSFLNQITLWVRQNDYLPTQIHMVDVNKTDVTYLLSNIRSASVGRNTFRISKAGAEVIDLR